MNTLLTRTQDIHVRILDMGIRCCSCNINNGCDISFRRYSETLDHLVRHNMVGDDAGAVVFAYINALKRAEGDLMKYDNYTYRLEFFEFFNHFTPLE